MPTENRSSNTEMVSVAPVQKRNRIYVEVRECEGCNHIGIDDAHSTLGACHECDWSGPEPVEDKCPGCGRENVIAAACPDCGSRYVLAASKEFDVPAPQPHPDPIAWMVGTAFWWTIEEAERDAAETGLMAVPVGQLTGTDEVERLRSIERSYGLREALLEQVKGERDRMIARTMELADQLAERDALLRKIQGYHWANVNPEERARTRAELRDLLSANAEPSEERGSSHGFEQSPNTCRHDERNGVWWKEGSVTRTGQECRACGNVQEDPVASAEPSAPVEIDERAEFELAYQRAADCGWTSTKMLSRRIWDARAALGRKPQVKP